MANGYSALVARWRVSLGFILGIIYLVFARPTANLIILGGGIALVGLVIRGWAAGYLEKGRNLATSGPYGFTRNPLYFGSFWIGSGFMVAGGSWWLGGIFLILFAAVYWPVMRREANSLRARFARDYERYAESTPLFLPRGLSTPRKPDQDAPVERFRWGRYRQNREYKAALGYLAGVLVLVLKTLLR